MFNVRDVQTRLHQLGYDPGPIDGIRGRRTYNAVKQFQRDRGLEIDGLVGPITEAALFKVAATKSLTNARSVDAMPWLDQAGRMLGVHEVRNRSRLMAWLRSDGATLGDPAKLPWCGDFVQTAIALALPDEPIPTNPYLARNWQKFGIACPPVKGAVAVFWRGKRNGTNGHVGFVAKRDPVRKRLLTLGGNQSNSVTEAWLSENRLLATRWPMTALPHGGEVEAASSEGAELSTNES